MFRIHPDFIVKRIIPLMENKLDPRELLQLTPREKAICHAGRAPTSSHSPNRPSARRTAPHGAAQAPHADGAGGAFGG